MRSIVKVSLSSKCCKEDFLGDKFEA